MRILVTGATGYVGSRLVTALLADRHRVMAASRNPERLKRFGWFTDVAWSPDGTRLLVPWRSADQWLFIQPAGGSVSAVGAISGAFSPGHPAGAPFPRPAGWCCSAP